MTNLREMEITAEAYARGQADGRAVAWVDEFAFIERAVTERAPLWEMDALYDRMLAEGTHVKRFEPGGCHD